MKYALQLAATLLLCSCAASRGRVEPEPEPEPEPAFTPPPPQPAVFPTTLPPPTPAQLAQNLGATCDPTRSIAPDSNALIVRDPQVLARFPLERVLSQIIATGSSTITPLELLQRVFDTENTSQTAVFPDAVHCDAALPNGAQVECPRAEAKLARSTTLLEPGDPDAFEPIALVNRFDLIPTNYASCGEYRIVYAKHSGRTDANDRVFFILEGAIKNPDRSLAACRPAAELWASLPSLTDNAAVADRLEHFFFEGGEGLLPVIHADNYGLRTHGQCDYAGDCGQLRLGQGMQSPWQFRQFRLTAQGSSIAFAPVTVTGTARADLFDTTSSDQNGDDFRSSFAYRFLPQLRGDDLSRLRLLTFSMYESFESSVAGPGQPDYAARAARGSNALAQEIESELDRQKNFCENNEHFTADVIFRRATASTCAGCHAPDELLPPDRSVGCGKTWPNSLGRTHIDENGQLSDALTQLFLPHRANVLSTYLQACDMASIVKNLEPLPPSIIIECFVTGTPIAMADGSQKPIEQIATGEAVLSLDAASGQVVPAYVERTVTRPHADRLITINGSLIATANHPFYTARGLTRADELEVGDALIELRGAGSSQLSAATRSVWQLALSPANVQTYNIVVAGHHNYFAGGLLVHDRP